MTANAAHASAGDHGRRVRARYDRLAGVYDRRWSRYIAATTRETLARLALEPGDRVLDLGCGTGALLRELVLQGEPARLRGVDLSPAMLAQARATLPGAVSLVAGDAVALPLAASSVDVVVSGSSFHFWAQPDRGLEEIRRVLRPGGRLVMTDWCGDYLACRLYDFALRLLDPAHRRTYGREECGGLLRTMGFADVHVERYRVSWPWGMMTATARTPES
jgi:ubiquinone/menaquinone biosynthesis C-methylase UbiE